MSPIIFLSLTVTEVSHIGHVAFVPNALVVLNTLRKLYIVFLTQPLKHINRWLNKHDDWAVMEWWMAILSEYCKELQSGFS